MQQEEHQKCVQKRITSLAQDDLKMVELIFNAEVHVQRKRIDVKSYLKLNIKFEY